MTVRKEKKLTKKEKKSRVFKYGQWMDPNQTHSHITFRDPDNLKDPSILKLKDHKMKLSNFLRMCVYLLLDEDPRMMDLIDEYKIKHKIQAKSEISKLKRERRKQEKYEESFNFSKEEIAEIYDIMESENTEE